MNINQFKKVVAEIIEDIEKQNLAYQESEHEFSFTCDSLVQQDTSFLITLYSNGTIELTKGFAISETSCLDTNIDNSIVDTLFKTKIVKTGEYCNYWDVVDFIEDILNTPSNAFLVPINHINN